jgi:hypothetical protein
MLTVIWNRLSASNETKKQKFKSNWNRYSAKKISKKITGPASKKKTPGAPKLVVLTKIKAKLQEELFFKFF